MFGLPFPFYTSFMKIAYIAHPIGGNVKLNLIRIRRIVKQINLEEPDVVPFVPYYADCVSLDDSDPEQRARGMKNNNTLFRKTFISELRLYGNKLSNGMLSEIMLAWEHDITVIAMTPETKKEYDLYLDCLNSPY